MQWRCLDSSTWLYQCKGKGKNLVTWQVCWLILFRVSASPLLILNLHLSVRLDVFPRFSCLMLKMQTILYIRWMLHIISLMYSKTVICWRSIWYIFPHNKHMYSLAGKKGRTHRMSCREGTYAMSWKNVSEDISQKINIAVKGSNLNWSWNIYCWVYKFLKFSVVSLKQLTVSFELYGNWQMTGIVEKEAIFCWKVLYWPS